MPDGPARPRAPTPVPPDRQFSFTSWQVANPSAPPPGDRLDAEFDRSNAAIEDTIAWVSTTLNSDGTLRPGSVGESQVPPGLVDEITAEIVADVQPLVNQAQNYAAASAASATQAAASASKALTSGNAAVNSAVSASTDAASAADASANAANAAAGASNAATWAFNSASNAAGAEAVAEDYADVTAAWAEHMPDPIPPNLLAVMGITGDHWSARWWANRAAQIVEGQWPGGPFLPLSGGTVTGPLVRTNVSYDMLASGAVGNGTTDDAAVIQTWLNSLPTGVEVVLPANHQFLIDSADLTIPAGITIRGNGGLEGSSNLVGPAFILNPNYRIVVVEGTRLSNFKILRKGLLAAPSTAQANAAVAAWAAEAKLLKTSASTASGNTLPFANTSGITVGMRVYGNEIVQGSVVTSVVANTSVTFTQVNGPFPVPQGAYVHFGNSVALVVTTLSGRGGVNLDRLFILGFNTGIVTQCGHIFADSLEIDCITAMLVTKGGDASYISKVHCIPYYGGDWNRRPGPNFLLTRADGWSLEACSSVGWATGFVLSNISGLTLNRCWTETLQDGVTVTTGFRTEIGIGNEITFLNCVALGSIPFDLQHGFGYAVMIGCASAASSPDATSVCHYRLGPGSTGVISTPTIVSGGITPFVVQAGVGSWQIVTPQIYAAPNPWISGAAADLANVGVIGGPQGSRGSAPYTIRSSFSAPTYSAFGFMDTGSSTAFGIYAYGNKLAFGGVDQSTGNGNSVWVDFDTVGNMTFATGGGITLGNVGTDPSKTVGGIEMYPGYGGFGVTPGTLNYNWNGVHQFLAGASPLMKMSSAGIAMQVKIGFNGITPIAKPIGWAAATGTATRTTFVTSSVTLASLAEHVKALIDDLTAYGLIGP